MNNITKQIFLLLTIALLPSLQASFFSKIGKTFVALSATGALGAVGHKAYGNLQHTFECNRAAKRIETRIQEFENGTINLYDLGNEAEKALQSSKTIPSQRKKILDIFAKYRMGNYDKYAELRGVLGRRIKQHINAEELSPILDNVISQSILLSSEERAFNIQGSFDIFNDPESIKKIVTYLTTLPENILEKCDPRAIEQYLYYCLYYGHAHQQHDLITVLLNSTILHNHAHVSRKSLNNYAEILNHKKLQLEKGDKNSPSLKHLALMTKDERLGRIPRIPWKGPDVFDQFAKALQFEKQMHENGYVCFYHGQSMAYGVTNDLRNSLIKALNSDLETKNFQFIQVQHKDTKEMHTPAVLAHEHTKVMTQVAREESLWNSVLCANLFAFGNATSMASSTLDYVNRNDNINKGQLNKELMLKIIFEPFNISEELYTRYEEKFEQLFVLSAQLFKTGRLLQIAIPKDNVDQFVYVSPGATVNLTALMDKIPKIPTVPTKVSEIIKKLDENPTYFSPRTWDLIEYCIPLTLAGALNPHRGIQVFSYDYEPQDQKLHNEYQKLFNELSEKLAQDIKQENDMQAFKNFAENIKSGAQISRPSATKSVVL